MAGDALVGRTSRRARAAISAAVGAERGRTWLAGTDWRRLLGRRRADQRSRRVRAAAPRGRAGCPFRGGVRPMTSLTTIAGSSIHGSAQSRAAGRRWPPASWAGAAASVLSAACGGCAARGGPVHGVVFEACRGGRIGVRAWSVTDGSVAERRLRSGEGGSGRGRGVVASRQRAVSSAAGRLARVRLGWSDLAPDGGAAGAMTRSRGGQDSRLGDGAEVVDQPRAGACRTGRPAWWGRGRGRAPVTSSTSMPVGGRLLARRRRWRASGRPRPGSPGRCGVAREAGHGSAAVGAQAVDGRHVEGADLRGPGRVSSAGRRGSRWRWGHTAAMAPSGRRADEHIDDRVLSMGGPPGQPTGSRCGGRPATPVAC